MATVAGTINDLSNGVFHAKDENGNLFFVFSNRKYVFLKNGNPWQ